MGADVIKIDPPFQRNAPPPTSAAAGDGAASARRPAQVFGKHARNKRSLRIDLRLPAGRALVKRLVAECDALVENFSARVMPNFGLGYDVLRRINPGLVILSMPGYGMTGPYREYLGYGSATEAMTGLTALLGYPGEEPRLSAIAYPDAVAGLAGCAALLTALVHRQATGAGQLIDLSQLEPTTLMLGEYFFAFQMTGARPERMGNRHPDWVPHGTYRCMDEGRRARSAGDGDEAVGTDSTHPSDEWVSIAVRSDDEWQRFCGVAGLDAAPALATETGRRAHRDAVDALVSGWTRGRDKFEVMERLQRAGIPAGAVLNAKEMLENPHLAHRGFFVEARAADGASFLMPGTPLAFDGRRREDWHAAPTPGEHNQAILKEVLGLSDEEIAALTEAGVLAGAASPVG
jgi:crotonobetainyl-CoA:carnitine CoA-transferase CaiB-like acyl-CoA transferase